MVTFKVSAGTPVVPAGSYPATLIDIREKQVPSQFTNPPGQLVDSLEWVWLVEGPEQDVEITSLTSLAVTPKSNILKYLRAMLGAENVQLDMEINGDDLIGKKVMVGVIVADNGFSRIESVLAAPRARQASAASAPRAAAPQAPVEDDLPF